MSVRITKDATVIVRPLKEKFHAINKTVCMSCVNLEKAFNHVPRRAIWWALRTLGIEEWLVRLIQKCVKMPDTEYVLVATWVKSSVWKWVFTKILAWVPYSSSRIWKSFLQDVCGKTYVQITWSSLLHHWSMHEKLILWKTKMERKGLLVNMGKTKVLISELGLDVFQKSDKDICTVCLKGVCTNSIFPGGCSRWVHKRPSGIPGPLKPDPSFRCKQCTGRPMKGDTVGGEKLEVVPSFCSLTDGLSSGGGCELASTTRCRAAWGKFNELLPILTSCSFLTISRGRVTICA